MLRLALRFFVFCIALTAFGAFTVIGARHSDLIEYWLWGNSSADGSTNLRIPEFVSWAETHTHPDVIFLGSSTCYRGIDPARFDAHGLSTYNLCSSSQSLAASRYVLDFALERTAPKRVVIDLYKGVWNSPCYQSFRDHILNNNFVADPTFQHMAFSTGDPFFSMQALYFSWKRTAVPLPPLLPGSADNYVGRGFVSSTSGIMDIQPCELIRPELHRENRDAFAYIAQACAKAGAELILLAPPMTCEGPSPWLENVKGSAGLRRIDGNEWPRAKVDTMYYDDHHLRAQGAQSYSDWLASKLAQK
jgi:hypothetical protein